MRVDKFRIVDLLVGTVYAIGALVFLSSALKKNNAEDEVIVEVVPEESETPLDADIEI